MGVGRLGILVLIALAIAGAGNAIAAEAISGYADAPADPQTPGYHKLLYRGTLSGAERSMPFVLYLPEGYGQTQQPWPLLVFLHGLGERGTDPQVLFSWGVPRDLAANPEMQKWTPFIILMPQCPPDVRWETPGVGRMVMDLVHQVAGHWPVDPKGLYMTGFSMGGSGCWAVAKESGGQFAAIAPIVANVFEPQAVADALRGTGTTCLVISGATDPKSEPGSTAMVEALRSAGVDVEHAKVPYGGHDLWPLYYGDKVFYQWLLSHRQGQKPPADRLKADAFVTMGAARTQKNQQRYKQLTDELQKVAQWWQIDNCSLERSPGLRPRLLNRPNVYVTQPFTKDVPCRLQTTTTLPTGKHVKLNMVVGHYPGGSWKLTVRVNEQEQFATTVDKAHSDHNWMTLGVDLSAYAGQEVRLQLVNANNGSARDDAYWQTIQILSN